MNFPHTREPNACRPLITILGCGYGRIKVKLKIEQPAIIRLFSALNVEQYFVFKGSDSGLHYNVYHNQINIENIRQICNKCYLRPLFNLLID